MFLGVLGLGVLATSIVVFLLRLLLRRAIPTRLPDLGVLLGAALAVASLFTGAPSLLAASAALVAVIWFVATRKELGLPDATLRISPGQRLPVVTLRSPDGAPVSELPRPALVVLYRGWWCPFCVTQLGELEKDHAILRAAGLAIVAISVDPPEEQAPLARRLPDVHFLSDEKGQLVDAVGVRHPDGVPWYDRLLFGAKKRDISLPVALIVDADGVVRYARRSRRIDERPPTAELVAAFSRTPTSSSAGGAARP
jgi:peroxiredoxin